jgi:hypothetical protein
MTNKTALQPKLDDHDEIPNGRGGVERMNREVTVTGSETVEPNHDQYDVERGQSEVVNLVGILYRRLVELQPGGEQMMNERLS